MGIILVHLLTMLTTIIILPQNMYIYIYQLNGFFLDHSINIANLIQPSLGQLQPNLDEFMDTIEPLQGTIFYVYTHMSNTYCKQLK